MKIKQIYRLMNHNELFSFNDPIQEVPILEKCLSKWQEETVQKAELQIVDIHDESEISDPYYLIFDNNIFFSYEFLKKALAEVKHKNCSIQFGIEQNRFNNRFSLPNSNDIDNSRKYNFFFKLKEDTELKQVKISQKAYTSSLTLPRQLMKTGELDYDQCDTYITTLLSPFHLLMVNMYMLVSHRFVKYRKRIPDRFQYLVHDRAPVFFRFLRMINKIGKKCKIHPTAIVEGCIIGDNVIIGANAVVRLSYIGDGSIVEDHCTILYSVLGSNTCISHNNLIVATMCYEEVYLIHGPYQFSIYGKNAAVFATINCDFRLDQKTMRIMTQHGLMDSGQQFMGIAVGHKSKIGGGNIIAPGRIVPNDYWVPSPKSIITEFPAEKNSNLNKDSIDWY
ncbi:MAG: hypothetical protein GY874_05780 [Desulfobacteraceae bacterium]|nr:hypothetical protein [Desulfobacteraceae bacterium]